MNCPECHSPATSVFRDLFSLQGVTRTQKAKGYFKCRSCGSLLQVCGYSNRIWYYYGPAILLLTVFALFYRSLIPMIGTGAIASIWIALVLIIFYSITFGFLKSAIIEKVEI